jgi:hypothetical protein
MKSVKYYREIAASVRRLDRMTDSAEIARLLIIISEDYSDLATDLEDGVIELIHPELLLQNHHTR